jgi:hypothetical protein
VIIVEGPDGAGKTTLLHSLMAQYPTIPLHARASEGVSGPVKELYEWGHDDVWSWPEQPLSFYDRHPFVSEYVYGPIIRGSMDPRFHTTPLRRRVASRALLIVCLPPLDAVRASVSAERDMPGVHSHIDAIWHCYASLRATWQSSTGIVFYDWTRDEPAALFPYINSFRNARDYVPD